MFIPHDPMLHPHGPVGLVLMLWILFAAFVWELPVLLVARLWH
jgi:hypothetical protein